jgi:F-type H+-transporting ATPase subunit b
MSGSTKIVSLCALAIVATAVFASRPCSAAESDAKLKTTMHDAAVEAEHSEHESGDPNPLAFSTDLALWTLVVFVVLFLVLKKFAWPQITEALEERERKIAATIADANAKLEDAKKLYAEHEAKLTATAGEVRALLDEARRDAEVTKKGIEAEGQKAAKEELDRALREIHRARDAAVQDLAVSSANVAIDLAQKIIREKLTPETNNQIVREAIAKLAPQPSNN